MRRWHSTARLCCAIALALTPAWVLGAEIAYLAPHQKPRPECLAVLRETDVALAAGAPVAGPQLSAPGDPIYLASYLADLQGGDLRAYRLGDVERPPGVNPAANVLAEPIWSARATLQAVSLANRRVVLTSLADGTGVPLRWDRIDTSLRDRLDRQSAAQDADGRGAARLDYLRGSRAHEGPGKTDFRQRSSLLGAIVNSTPWLMLAPSAGYIEALAPGYPAFRQAGLARPSLLFVGAGDGMLHGFSAVDGAPVMAYVPRALGARLAALSVSGEPARPYVDGSPLVADVNLDLTPSGWRSYLFAPLGRGAQGLVALDVTRGMFSEDDAANIVKWEFTDQHDAQLGHLIDRPGIDEITGRARQVVRLGDGKWAILLGNGHGSEVDDGHAGSGAAYLFVVYVTGPSGAGGTWVEGRDYLKIATGPRGAGPRNGLGQPFAIDRDGDGLVDLVYAGDRKGNVWKFDLSGSDPLRWRAAFGDAGRPFYAAGAALSVSAAVLATPHPLGGHMVHFGTGRALAENDLPTTQVQTVFGIWDRPGAAGPPAAGRARLLRQSASRADQGDGVLGSALHVDDWTSVDGWLLDLPMPSESLLEHPAYRGRQLMFKTVFKARPGHDCDTGWGGNLWLLDALDGATPLLTFDRNGDGVVNRADLHWDGQGAPRALSGKFIGQGAGESARSADGQLVRGGDTGAAITRMRTGAPRKARRRWWREIGD